jgi:hypothetical protein
MYADSSRLRNACFYATLMIAIGHASAEWVASSAAWLTLRFPESRVTVTIRGLNNVRHSVRSFFTRSC